MARVLFAWEFGGDLGHVRRIVPIARELRAIGHEPVLAFRDLTALAAHVHEDFEWLAAPRLRGRAQPNPSPLNASDILLNLGFGDPPGLSGALRAWLALFNILDPALIVADYAPTALLAGRAAQRARITLGTGFALPPRADPLPALRSWAPCDEATLRGIDGRLLAAIDAALQRLPKGAQALRHVSSLYDSRAHLLCTFPEIDPFGPRDDVEYLGPQADGSGIRVSWTSAKRKVFAYLKPRDARFGAIVSALDRLGAEAIVAAPGLDPQDAAALATSRVRVFAEPVDLETVLPDCDLCVCPGGPGLVARAWLAGVPMGLAPMQLEQFLVARRALQAGVASMVAPDAPAPDFAAWFAALLEDTKLREMARERAREHLGYRFDQAAKRIALRIAREIA
ncbi:MAG: glycosyltransferase [Bacillota bacterium]